MLLIRVLLFLAIMATVLGEDFLRFWPSDTSFLQPTHVSRALFVTSWNKAGQNAALKHASKFQAIILCLYDLHFDKKRFRLQKVVQIEPSFLKELRNANPSLRVFLRIFVVGSARSLFEYVSSSTKKIAQVAAGIVRVMRREKATGVYFDSPFNLPMTGPAAGPYDKFASLLNGYIANKIKELLWESQQLMFTVHLGDGVGVEEVDFTALKQVRFDTLMVQNMGSPLADVALSQNLKFINQMRSKSEGQTIEYFIAVPLFSWRNGIGVKTGIVKDSLDKNGVAVRGFKNGLCTYVQRVGGAECNVPCEHYFQVVKKYAGEARVKLAFFEAGDAIDGMFEMI